ncbi:MAG TPA: hypothetical protein VFZ52_21615 [Chryseolinea sp.]
MRKFIFSIIVSISLLSVACSGKKEGDHDAHHSEEIKSDAWKEMDDFHMIMAEAFHPYKDSSNLEPAKQNAAALTASAESWSGAPLPAMFEGDDEIKFKLNQLKSDAAKFEQVVAAGDEKAIGESLTKLHDLFHEIQESWYGGGHGEEH